MIGWGIEQALFHFVSKNSKIWKWTIGSDKCLQYCISRPLKVCTGWQLNTDPEKSSDDTERQMSAVEWTVIVCDVQNDWTDHVERNAVRFTHLMAENKRDRTKERQRRRQREGQIGSMWLLCEETAASALSTHDWAQLRPLLTYTYVHGHTHTHIHTSLKHMSNHSVFLIPRFSEIRRPPGGLWRYCREYVEKTLSLTV